MADGPTYNPDNTPAYAPEYPSPYNAPGHQYAFDLNWIVERLKINNHGINTNRENIDKNRTDLDELGNSLAEALRQIRLLQAKLCNGEFAKDDFLKWADNNLPCIVGNAAQHVFPGLTPDGHIVFFMPANWQFLDIDVIADPDSPCYGRITLKF